MAVGDTALRGVDEFFNSAGVKLAPLGFGVNTDWEVIDRIEVNAATATVELGVDTFDPTLYDEIEITISELVMTTATQGIRVRVSDDNGATFEAGATDYAYSWSTNRDDSATEIEARSSGTTFFEIYNGIGADAGDSSFWKFQGGRMDSSRNKIFNWTGGRWDGAVFVGGMGGGGVFQGNTNAIDAFQFFATTNDIAEGLFVLRGRRRGGAPVLISQDDWAVISRAEVSAVETHDVFWPDQVYDQIEVTMMGLVVTVDAVDIDMLFSTDGSTFITSASYDVIRHGVNTSGSGDFKVQELNDTSFNQFASLGNVGDEMGSATTVIYDVSNTTKKKMFTSDIVSLNSFSLRQDLITGQFAANNDPIVGMRLDAASTNTFSGTIVVRGRRKTPIGTLKQDWEVLNHQALTGNLAEIEFTDIPVEAFDEFELIMKDVDADTTGNNILLQISTDNGATWSAAANYDYELSIQSIGAANSTTDLTNQTSITISTTFGSNTNRGLHGKVNLFGLEGLQWPWIESKLVMSSDTGVGVIDTAGGRFDGTGGDGNVTAFRLDLSAGGNFIAGSKFTLRGRRKQ